MIASRRLSKEGRVSIPQGIREHLGLEPPDRIEFVIDPNGAVRIQKADLTLEDIVGIFPALNLPDDEVKRITREARAEHLATTYH